MVSKIIFVLSLALLGLWGERIYAQTSSPSPDPPNVWLIYVGDEERIYLTGDYFEENPEGMHFWQLTALQGTGKANISIELSFCNECGKWRLSQRKKFLPTLRVDDNSTDGESTGDILRPVRPVLKLSFDPNSDNQFLGFHFQASGCIFSLKVVNESDLQSHPQPPVPGNRGKISTDREGENVTVRFAPATDSSSDAADLEYKPFFLVMLFGEVSVANWCDWSDIPGHVLWVSNAKSFAFVVDQFSEAFVKVQVRNKKTGFVADYETIKLDSTDVENIARTLGEFILAFVIAIPVLVIYGGYARSFGFKMLAVQPITVDPNTLPTLGDVPIIVDEDGDHGGNSDNTSESEGAAGESVTDLMLFRAQRHASAFISTQFLLVLGALVAGTIVSGLSVAAVIFTGMMLPVLMLAVVGVARASPGTVVTYMTTMCWFTGLQLAVMIFKINFGSDILNVLFFSPQLVSNMTSFGEPIITFFLDLLFSATAVVLFIVSMSPLSFMFIKGSQTFQQRLISITWLERVIMLLTGVAFLLPLLSASLAFHYIPLSPKPIPWPTLFRLFVDTQFELGFALLGLFGALAAICRNSSFCLMAMFVQPAHFFSTFVFGIVEAQQNMDLWGDELGGKNAVIAFRWLSLVLEIVIFVLLGAYWKKLQKEPLKSTMFAWLPTSWKDLHGVIRVVASFSCIVLGFMSILVVATEYTVDVNSFPPLFLALFCLMLNVPTALVGSIFASVLLAMFSVVLDVPGLFMMYSNPSTTVWLVVFFIVLIKEVTILFEAFLSICCGRSGEEFVGTTDMLDEFRDEDQEIELEDADKNGNGAGRRVVERSLSGSSDDLQVELSGDKGEASYSSSSSGSQ